MDDERPVKVHDSDPDVFTLATCVVPWKTWAIYDVA
jgi:hypothetical protein